MESCRTLDCTVADTGVCLLGNDPNNCEFRIREEQGIAEQETIERLSQPVLDAPEERPTLWGSLPLELDDVRQLMASRDCLLVGVVGTPAAGKTAALVSMYLLLAHGRLEGFQFADSKSLMALEEISQGARLWGPNPPDEMTVRTKMSGSRVAGFLHLKVKELESGKYVDLLIPDLPGEWSDTLIDNNRTDRLDFVRASKVVWVFVNGGELRQSATRMFTLNWTSLLIQRVASMLGQYRPPIKIVVTHADAGPLSTQTVDKLSKILTTNGLNGEIVHVASFSNTEIAAGSGLPKLITSSIPFSAAPPADWPEDGEGTEGRFMLRYAKAPRS